MQTFALKWGCTGVFLRKRLQEISSLKTKIYTLSYIHLSIFALRIFYLTRKT